MLTVVRDDRLFLVYLPELSIHLCLGGLYTEIVHLKNNIVVATTVVVVGTKKVLCGVVVYISSPSIEGNTSLDSDQCMVVAY